MSFKRRLAAAGMWTAGVTVFAAALAFAGQPASAGSLAAVDAATSGASVVARTAPCDRAGDCPAGPEPVRGQAGYGTPSPTPTASHGVGPGVTASPVPTRGNGGYGSVNPTTSPTTSPTATPTPSSTFPGGVSPDHVPEETPGGVRPDAEPDDGGSLPVTGISMGALAGLGGLLTVAGFALVRYTRRRTV